MAETIIALDPGPKETAWVKFNGTLLGFGKGPNDTVLDFLYDNRDSVPRLVIEKIAGMGMAVGAEVFETCVWTGRFMEAFGAESVTRIPRLEIKIHLCGSARAKDANIRRVLMDLFGGDASVKKGGALYKVTKDVWSALAVAVTWKERFDASRDPQAIG